MPAVAGPPAPGQHTLSFDTDSFRIGVDTCASVCFTNTRSDFVSPPTPCNTQIRGVGGDSQALEVGTVRWYVVDDTGTRRLLQIPGTYYAPSIPDRLLSPQHLAQVLQDNEGTGVEVGAKTCKLYWQRRQYQLTCRLDTATNIPYIRSAPGYARFQAFAAVQESGRHQHYNCFPAHIIPDDSEVADDDKPGTSVGLEQPTEPPPKRVRWANPSPSMQHPAATAPTTTASDASTTPSTTPHPVHIEFDDLPESSVHQRDEPELPNASHELMRWHLRLGHLPFYRLRLMGIAGDLPRAIVHAKTPFCAACQFGKATRRPKRFKGAGNEREIRTATAPGQIVSVDQLESRTPGLVAHQKGRPTTLRYQYATVFVDHYSRFSFVYLQTSISSTETLQAKHAFEREAADNGIACIRHYHADNGRFADRAWVADVHRQGQTTSYCGVNAHFQNGIAEKHIRDLQEGARTMLAHAKHRWPAAITPHLWPYALRNASDMHNIVPIASTGKTPAATFAASNVRPNMHHYQTFGCPAYVLDNTLQSGGSTPKWADRARVGIYLGQSRTHASSVGLILNTQTGLVSPQFHVKFDNLFETTKEPVTKVIRWQIATGFRASEGVDAPTLGISKGPPEIRPSQHPSQQQQQLHSPPSRSNEGDMRPSSDPERPPSPSTGPLAPEHVESPSAETTPLSRPTRSGRQPKLTQRAQESQMQRQDGLVAWWATSETPANDYDWYKQKAQQDYDLQKGMMNPIAFAASMNNDTMYLGDALKAPDSDKFRAAMRDEIDAHTNHGHWKVVSKTTVPKGTRILDAVWSMKRKRRLDTQEVYKHKARLTVHGGQQQHGVNFWETYAPVVSWSSIRLFLTHSLLRGWHTRQVDFVLAFPQADVETDIYMKIPAGYHRNDADPAEHCLKLIKNVYGTRQGPRTWSKHLTRGLLNIGFKQSAVKPCLFYRGTVAFLIYVDDGILAGPSETDIEQAIEDLMNARFDIEDMGNIKDYLGVQVRRTKDGKLLLTQPHLIDSILDDLHFQHNTKTKDVPAPSEKRLDHDEHLPAHTNDFHYRRVIGKLNFLEKSTRPDIAYSVHQCARFSINPRESHAAAVRQIGRYLLKTKKEGIILDPKQESFECFVDADFAGLWNEETAAYDPITSKSRSGYVIQYAGCPLVWQSRLQTITALSTAEAELIALSTALRDVIPIMELVKETAAFGLDLNQAAPKIHCKAFEDNSGALEIAKEYKIRPQTKHINIRYHHFREHVERGDISIHPIATGDQVADIFTKPLPADLFEHHRNTLMGW